MEVLSRRSYFRYSMHLFLCLCACIAFFYAQVAYAADVVLSPSTGSYSTGQTFTVTVQAQPNGDHINAVEAQLSFDPAVLSVVSVSKTGSVFSLWTTEPAFSNSAGTIEFGGGSPTPFSSRSTLLSITFRAAAEGAAAVSFDSASALAADGLGTDVLENSPDASYTVAEGTTPEPTEDTASDETTPEEGSDTAIAFGDPPRAPEVGSQQFLDPEVWYNETDGLFTWELPFDVSAVAVEIATSSEHDPEEVFDPPVEEFTVSDKNLVDGIQYLSVQFENQVGWGGISNRKIQIDTQPPEDFEIKVQASNSKTGFPLLVFDAVDETSGIASYELVIADQEPIEITPKEARLGYLLKELEDGTYTVKVTAYDKAGNETVSTTPVLITAGWVAEVETNEKSAFWAFFTPINILIIVLIIIVIGEFAFIIYQRRQYAKQEEKLRKETREVHDQMEKIFSALRDEIYDQINMITKRPEVSETLIDKEINDVKKILK